MTQPDKHRKVSKFLSYVLRHKPESIGLQLDTAGWGVVDQIINKAPFMLTLDLIRIVVAENDKQRFSLSEDERFIRANQGHSIKVDLGLKPQAPPTLLYHGTSRSVIDKILAEGLKPQSRQHVHLSIDVQTAIKVGQRHGKPVVLQLPALAMHDEGHVFFCAANGVWLTSHVPADRLLIVSL